MQLHAAALRNSRAVYGITQCYLPPGSCDIPTRSVQSSSCAVNKPLAARGQMSVIFGAGGRYWVGQNCPTLARRGDMRQVCVCVSVRHACTCRWSFRRWSFRTCRPPPLQRRRRRAMICRLSTSPGRAGTVTCPLEGRVHLRSSALE